MFISAYPFHSHLQNPARKNTKFTLVSDKRGNIFKRNNKTKELVPTGMRRYPIQGTLNLGIKQFKRTEKPVRGKVVRMYKEYAWEQVEKGLTEHIEAKNK